MLKIKNRRRLSAPKLRQRRNKARAAIREFLEKVYNDERLHSALGYLPPAEFERKHTDAAARPEFSQA